jgi:hypothetical protein
MMHVEVRNGQLNSAGLVFSHYSAVSIIGLHYICLKGLAQRNEGKVEGTVWG